MVVQERLLQKLSDVFNRCQTTDRESILSQEQRIRMQYKAQSEWFGAIAALETILLADLDSLAETTSSVSGLLLSGPLPILSHPHLISRFQSGIFTPEACQTLSLIPFQLPASQSPCFPNVTSNLQQLILLTFDPTYLDR